MFFIRSLTFGSGWFVQDDWGLHSVAIGAPWQNAAVLLLFLSVGKARGRLLEVCFMCNFYLWLASMFGV